MDNLPKIFVYVLSVVLVVLLLVGGYLLYSYNSSSPDSITTQTRNLKASSNLSFIIENPGIEDIVVIDNGKLKGILKTMEEGGNRTSDTYIVVITDEPQEIPIETKRAGNDKVKIRSYSYLKNDEGDHVIKLHLDQSLLNDSNTSQLAKDLYQHVAYTVYVVNHIGATGHDYEDYQIKIKAVADTEVELFEVIKSQ